MMSIYPFFTRSLGMNNCFAGVRRCVFLIASLLLIAACATPERAAPTPADADALVLNSQPLIPRRADPWVHRTEAGHYFFIATSPKFDQIELRGADSVQ